MIEVNDEMMKDFVILNYDCFLILRMEKIIYLTQYDSYVLHYHNFKCTFLIILNNVLRVCKIDYYSDASTVKE